VSRIAYKLASAAKGFMRFTPGGCEVQLTGAR
jgi:hypothetical protein